MEAISPGKDLAAAGKSRVFPLPDALLRAEDRTVTKCVVFSPQLHGRV